MIHTSRLKFVFRKLRQKKRIQHALWGVLSVAVGMHQWKRAYNTCDKISRVKRINVWQEKLNSMTDNTIVSTLKLTYNERKWLKCQLVANSKTAGSLLLQERDTLTAKDQEMTEEMIEVNNSILRKLF